MSFVPAIMTSHAKRPFNTQVSLLHKLIRDQFTIQTWLAFGAVAQSLLLLLPIRPIYTIAPAVVLLLFKAVDTLLITFKLKPNSYTAGVVDTKVTAIVPNADGSFGKQEGQNTPDRVAILLLGFKINHPLGPLAPGAAETMSYFQQMSADLRKNATTNGFLGSTTYLGASDSRSTKSEIMTNFYFRSIEDANTFAHGPSHREGWKWWSKVGNEYKYLAINHEVYEAPKGKFENVYVHNEPTGLGATTYQITDKDGQTKWISPLVNADKGQLKSAPGRWKAYD